jgi:hypothetical protein
MTLDPSYVQIVIPLILTLLASNGFWAYLMTNRDKKSDQIKLLTGLAHDRIITIGMKYITRGWITQDEYENMTVYLYKPYDKLGGNGSVKRIMTEIDKLPMRKDKLFDKITGDTIE